MEDRAAVMHKLFDLWGWQLPRSDDWWTSVKCGMHDDAHASARVYMNEGGFICLACGVQAGNPVGLVMLVEGLHYRAAYKRLQSLGLEQGGTQVRPGPRRPWKGRRKASAARIARGGGE